MKKILIMAALVLVIAGCLGSSLVFLGRRKAVDKVDTGTASGHQAPEPNFKAKTDNPTSEVLGTSGEDRTDLSEDREQNSGAINVSEAPQKTETSGQTETLQSPKPTNTAKPTKTPKPTNTAKPTKTPKPTNTAKPTKTPKPTNTAKPTKTPKPTNTAKPTTEPKSTDSEQNEGEERPYFKSKEDILITNVNQ